MAAVAGRWLERPPFSALAASSSRSGHRLRGRARGARARSAVWRWRSRSGHGGQRSHGRVLLRFRADVEQVPWASMPAAYASVERPPVALATAPRRFHQRRERPGDAPPPLRRVADEESGVSLDSSARTRWRNRHAPGRLTRLLRCTIPLVPFRRTRSRRSIGPHLFVSVVSHEAALCGPRSGCLRVATVGTERRARRRLGSDLACAVPVGDAGPWRTASSACCATPCDATAWARRHAWQSPRRGLDHVAVRVHLRAVRREPHDASDSAARDVSYRPGPTSFGMTAR